MSSLEIIMHLRPLIILTLGAAILVAHAAEDDGLIRNGNDDPVPAATPAAPATTPAPPAAAPVPPAAPAAAAVAPGKEDAHFLYADDWFTSELAYANEGWIYVYLSKQLQAPAEGTRNEGQYLKVGDGKELWTRHAWRSRPAVAADLRLGATIIIFESNSVDEVYRAPRDRENARHGSWFLSKITDLDQLFKQVVRAGSYNAHTGAIRVPMK